MKPPSRTTRSTKSASQWLKRKPIPKERCNQNSNDKWSNGELRNIVTGLKHQFRSKLDDIDTCALQTRVPNRSVPEVELLLKALKLSVGRKVHNEVKKQRQDEQQRRVPIEIWTELMERIAGKHKEKISSGFSRMLVIAGTEPCSLQHSHPPRDPDNPSSTTMSLRTIPKFSTGGNGLNSDAQISSTADAQQLSGKEGPSLDKNKDMSPKPPLSSNMSTEAVVSSGSSTFTSAIQHVQTKAFEFVQSRTQNNHSSSFSALSSVPKQQSGRLEDTVDFEKLYTFLSTACKGDGEASLTAMECAVVLDLIMSLPEELPHMHCESLQEHFWQVYARLTTLVKVPLKSQNSAPTIEGEEALSGIEAEELTQRVSHLTKVSPTWENVGICPLNPLMVPLSLLSQKNGDQDDDL